MITFRQRLRRTAPVTVLDLAERALIALRRAARAGLALPRRTLAGVLTAAVAVLAGLATLVVVLLPAPRPSAPRAAPTVADAGTAPSSRSAAPGLAAGAASPVSLAAPTAHAPARPAPRAENTSVPLIARYSTVHSALLGYRASVVITNPGPAPVADWTLVVTLSGRNASVTEVTGAQARRSDGGWTFVAAAGAPPVGPGGSVEVRFRVSGTLLSAQPTACTLDGRACEGIPG